MDNFTVLNIMKVETNLKNEYLLKRRIKVFKNDFKQYSVYYLILIVQREVQYTCQLSYLPVKKLIKDA